MAIERIESVYIRSALRFLQIGLICLFLSVALIQWPILVVVLWILYFGFVIKVCILLWGIYRSRKHYPLQQREKDLVELIEMIKETNERIETIQQREIMPQDREEILQKALADLRARKDKDNET